MTKENLSDNQHEIDRKIIQRFYYQFDSILKSESGQEDDWAFFRRNLEADDASLVKWQIIEIKKETRKSYSGSRSVQMGLTGPSISLPVIELTISPNDPRRDSPRYQLPPEFSQSESYEEQIYVPAAQIYLSANGKAYECFYHGFGRSREEFKIDTPILPYQENVNGSWSNFQPLRPQTLEQIMDVITAIKNGEAKPETYEEDE